MNDVLVIFKQALLQRFDGYLYSIGVIRRQVDQSQQRLKDSQLMFSVFDIVD